MRTTTIHDQASTYTQCRLGDMPPHVADATRQAMRDDGYLHDRGGGINTFSPFDDMDGEYYWLRRSYVAAALARLDDEKRGRA